MLLLEDLSDDELLELLNAVLKQWRMAAKAIKLEEIANDNGTYVSRSDKLRDKYIEVLNEVRDRNLRLSMTQLAKRIIKEY